jgi:hypothetical protein
VVGVSYMLIMRHCWGGIPASAGLRDITSSHVQFWIWPAKFARALVLAAVFYPLRVTLLGMGRLGGMMGAGVMIGIGRAAGFNGVIRGLHTLKSLSSARG